MSPYPPLMRMPYERAALPWSYTHFLARTSTYLFIGFVSFSWSMWKLGTASVARPSYGRDWEILGSPQFKGLNLWMTPLTMLLPWLDWTNVLCNVTCSGCQRRCIGFQVVCDCIFMRYFALECHLLYQVYIDVTALSTGSFDDSRLVLTGVLCMSTCSWLWRFNRGYSSLPLMRISLD